MRLSLTILHYGAEYLAWALRSVESAVDGFVIAYTDQPSHGQSTHELCPETEDQLLAEAHRFVKKPIYWTRGRYGNEGLHRQAAYDTAKNLGASQILVLDADEIWDPASAASALSAMAARPEAFARVRFLHLWRSFNWVCEDPSWPDRLKNVGGAGEWYVPFEQQPWPVIHLGYAQSEAITRYKISIHGHLNEWRPKWMEEKFLGWKPGDKDVHPTCRDNWWEPKPVQPPLAAKIKELLGDHPYFGTEVIR